MSSGGRGHRLAAGNGAGVGYEASSVWVFDQMQNALEELALSFWAADVDYGCIPELVPAETNDALTRIVIQRLQGFVDNQPARLMQQGTSENQPLLFVIGEFSFPARDPVERRGKTVQACGLERSYELLVFVDDLGGGGIGQRCAQRSQRHIGLARHEHHAVRGRQRNTA